MVDSVTKLQRSKNMAAIKSINTKPELIVRHLLFINGLRYRLHDKQLPGSPDIVLKKYKTAILIHGCFWHHHKNCSRSFLPKSNKQYWWPKIYGNVIRDQENEGKLKKLGWNVIKIWECDVGKPEKLFSKLFLRKSSIIK